MFGIGVPIAPYAPNAATSGLFVTFAAAVFSAGRRSPSLYRANWKSSDAATCVRN